MKFFKLIICLLKRWKVLLTLGSVFGFAYCGFVDNGQGTNYTWSASTGTTSDTAAVGGRVSSSGGSSSADGSSSRRSSRSSGSQKKLIIETEDEDQSIDIDDYIEQVAFFYVRRGRCGQVNQIDTFKTCHNACVANSQTTSALNTCKNTCTTASNTCEYQASHTGSGVFYDTDKILTNHHVIEDILTYRKTGKTYFAIYALFENYEGTRKSVDSVEWHDAVADVAMVELESDMPGAVPVRLGALSDLSLLSPVFTIGNPLDLRWVAGQGRIAAYGRSADHADIYHTIRTYGGNSGGGLFDLDSGKLIGLHKANHQDRYLSPSQVADYPTRNFDDDSNIQTYGVGTHVDKIKELITSNRGAVGQNQVHTQSHFGSLDSEGLNQAYSLMVQEVIDTLEVRD